MKDRAAMWAIALLAVLTAAGLGVLAYLLWTAPVEAQLRIAADQVNSEPYEMASTIAHTVQRNYPGIRMRVVETGGSGENMQLLGGGKVDLALVQADAVARENVSLLAVLYPEMFQLLVQPDSAIFSFKHLEGKTVALPLFTSGQYRAFWFLANHYGVAPERINAIPMDDKTANSAVLAGKVHAIFRARGPRNDQIRMLVNDRKLRLVPIEQGRAIRLRQPVFNPAIIPTGAYRGDPPIPDADLPTIAVDRLLVARDDLDEEVVRAITRVLFENRRDLVLRMPLAALIRQPELQAGTLLPVHPGALDYYEREKPSMLEEKAEFLALLFSITVVLVSALLAFNRRLRERRQSRIEDYAVELLALEKKAKTAKTILALNRDKERLTAVLAQVVDDVRAKRVSSEGLQLFAFVWESVNYTINDHEEQLRLGPGPPPGPAKIESRRKPPRLESRRKPPAGARSA